MPQTELPMPHTDLPMPPADLCMPHTALPISQHTERVHGQIDNRRLERTGEV